MKTVVKGYKVTDKNMQCKGYQYSLNTRYKHEGSLIKCKSGFHFCKKLMDCFSYYSFNTENRVFEIMAYGGIIDDGDKQVTADIEFVKELTWNEVLELVNLGAGNTGLSNSGDRNSGDRNSGYRNSGNWNSGNSNSGDRNSGYRNSGNWNSGNSNSGDSNSGDRNSGYRNSGNSNSGYRNSGNWNSGDRNSGDSNSGYRNSGAFCTDKNPTLYLFNKPSSMSVKEWENHPLCQLMYRIDPTIWVPSAIMSDEEKKNHPGWETTEGYLKTITMKEAWANFWNNLTDDIKDQFKQLENFDAGIFEEITGIKTN